MKAALVVVIVGLCACGKSAEQKAQEKKLAQLEDKMTAALGADKARKPTGMPHPQAALKVTYDGKPIEMATALAWKDRYGGVRITASSVPVGCAEVTGDMRSLHDGEVTFDVTMGNLLQPDGSLKPVVQSTYFEGMTNQRTSEPVAGSGDGSPDQPTKLDVDFKTESAGEPKHAIEVKGTLDALGCAVAPSGAAAPLPPEMPATIEVAGKKLALRGASLSTVGDWPQLVLTTGGDACHDPKAATGEMRIELTWFDKAKPEVSQVSLGGSLLPPAIDQTYDKKKITVTPAPPTAPGEATLQADIEVNGYPVKLAGKVTAVACPK